MNVHILGCIFTYSYISSLAARRSPSFILLRSPLQNARTENTVPELREKEEEEEEVFETEEKHVEFDIAEDAGNEDASDPDKPNKLQRRDTPHHLKNKRINTTVDKEKVASIIAQVSHGFLPSV